MIIDAQLLPVDRAHIDTDQIIPARYLTGISKRGLGQYLFSGLPGGEALLADHPDANVVLTRENFGCGSSREHAAWALTDRGYRAVIATSFARIFLENAYNNGIVPIVLDASLIDRLFAASPTSLALQIDVEAQHLLVPSLGIDTTFALDPLRKAFILGGGYMQFLASKIDVVRAW